MNDICDLTNEIDILYSHIGLTYEGNTPDNIKESLKELLEITSAIMGSLRREKTLDRKYLSTTLCLVSMYKTKPRKVFHLPIGSEAISRLNICRAMSKKISRMYLKLYFKGISKDEVLKETIGELSNLFYYMSLHMA